MCGGRVLYKRYNNRYDSIVSSEKEGFLCLSLRVRELAINGGQVSLTLEQPRIIRILSVFITLRVSRDKSRITTYMKTLVRMQKGKPSAMESIRKKRILRNFTANRICDQNDTVSSNIIPML